jgi:hypothetical protein
MSHNNRSVKHVVQFMVGVAALVSVQVASATIIGAVNVTATNSFPNATFGTADNLINQGGLLTGYTSGVTDFDTYLASDPQHSIISSGNEWFTDFGVSSALLTFDLGAATVVDGLAAWVDEFWGAGTISVATSLDNAIFNNVGSFMPTDWATNVSSYGADVFTFGAVSTRYLQLTLSDCPQPDSVSGGGCGMGEVAFRQGTSAVPEPSIVALLGAGIVVMFLAGRRRA